MSFDINWDSIRNESFLNAFKAQINEAIGQDIKSKEYLGNLHIEKLELGPSAPDVAIQDISDPLPIFLSSANVSSATPNMGGSFEEEFMQFTVSAKYHDVVNIAIKCAPTLNFPATQFLSLPLMVRIKAIQFQGRIVIAKVREAIFMTLMPDPDSTLNIEFDTEIGDPQRHVLKNVLKVEAFVNSILLKLIDSLLTYPNHLKIK